MAGPEKPATSERDRQLQTYWTLRSVLAPTLRFCQYVYEDVLFENVKPDSRWLDLGCGHHVLPTWRATAERRLVGNCGLIVGLDYDFLSLRRHPTVSCRVRGDVTRLPFADRSFDLVTANMVVEHLDQPADQFREVHRVLRPGGRFIFHTPNAHSYFVAMRRLTPPKLKDGLVRLLDGRAPEDVFPVRYKANSRGKIDRYARLTGFNVLKTKMVASDAIFAVIPPLAALELLWIRILMTKPMRAFRTNIIAILERPDPAAR